MKTHRGLCRISAEIKEGAAGPGGARDGEVGPLELEYGLCTCDGELAPELSFPCLREENN